MDGAQLVPHRRVDLVSQGIDYLAFSGHKLYAPFGAGVLVGRSDWLDAGAPYLRGGGAVVSVTLAETSWRSGPARHEAGSPNVLGVAALARAVEEISSLDEASWTVREDALRRRLVAGLADVPGARVLRVFTDSSDPVGVVSFVVDGVESGLLASYLSAEWAVGVRQRAVLRTSTARPPWDHRTGIACVIRGGDHERARGPAARGTRGLDRPRVHDCATRSSTARGLSPTMHGRCQTGRPRRAPQRARTAAPLRSHRLASHRRSLVVDRPRSAHQVESPRMTASDPPSMKTTCPQRCAFSSLPSQASR